MKSPNSKGKPFYCLRGGIVSFLTKYCCVKVWQKIKTSNLHHRYYIISISSAIVWDPFCWHRRNCVPSGAKVWQIADQELCRRCWPKSEAKVGFQLSLSVRCSSSDAINFGSNLEKWFTKEMWEASCILLISSSILYIAINYVLISYNSFYFILLLIQTFYLWSLGNRLKLVNCHNSRRFFQKLL